MYLSIGNDMAVRDTSIIGIFDLDNTTYSKKTVAFLNQAEKEGMVIPCDDLPKSKNPRPPGLGFFMSFIHKRWGYRP